jgi:GNAT superfamily N-acetyltransferase
MQIKIIFQSELSSVINQIPVGISKGVLFGGDRFSCIDEGVAILEGEILIALATIAPNGEMMAGNPTIVGFWVNPQYRRQGRGQWLMKETINHCINRGFQRVQLDGLVEGIKHIYEALPSELQQYVDFKNLIVPGFPVFLD